MLLVFLSSSPTPQISNLAALLWRRVSGALSYWSCSSSCWFSHPPSSFTRGRVCLSAAQPLAPVTLAFLDAVSAARALCFSLLMSVPLSLFPQPCWYILAYLALLSLCNLLSSFTFFFFVVANSDHFCFLPLGSFRKQLGCSMRIVSTWWDWALIAFAEPALGFAFSSLWLVVELEHLGLRV